MNIDLPDASEDIGAKVLRLYTAWAKGEITAADRILEFETLLRSAKNLYVANHKLKSLRVYKLTRELLTLLKASPERLDVPNAPTTWRVTKQNRMTQLVAELQKEMEAVAGPLDNI